MKRAARWIPAALLLWVAVGCTPHDEKQPLDEVTVQLKWLHQAQFAGLHLCGRDRRAPAERSTR